MSIAQVKILARGLMVLVLSMPPLHRNSFQVNSGAGESGSASRVKVSLSSARKFYPAWRSGRSDGQATITASKPRTAILDATPFNSFFHTEGRDIVADSTGEKVVFRGINADGLEYGTLFNHKPGTPLPPYPGVLGTDYFMPRPEDFDEAKALGFNLIRVPFEWARLVTGWKPTDPLPTTLNPQYLGLLTQVVQMATARQLYVALDLHSFLKYWSGPSTQECVDDTDPARPYQRLLEQTWVLLAEHFRENRMVFYDIMNEPERKTGSGSCGSCNWHAIAQSVVNAIRAVDSNHLIFVEGPNFSLASNWPVENGKKPFITDRVNPSRIVYSPHVYFDFNNDSQYETGEEMGPVGQWEYYVRDRLLPVINWSIDNNVPLFIGETGVPCTAAWAQMLDYIFCNFIEPLRLSVAIWHYINPQRCPLVDCPLNLLACPERHQLNVLKKYPGGVYRERGAFIITPPDSHIYDDFRVNPWDAGDGFFGDVTLNFRAKAPEPVFEGNSSARVHFDRNNFAAVKFIHHFGLDTRQFRELKFRILLTGAGQQNFKVWTTAPRPDCSPGADPVYPRTFSAQPELRQYLQAPQPDQWQEVKIPLKDIADPVEPIINGIAFQNMGMSQAVFYLDDIRLVPENTDTVVSVSAASYSGSLFASKSIVAAFGTGLATTTQSASSQPLPTSLGGTTIKVKDCTGTERLAPLFFVSPLQINYQISPGTAAGAATVTVTSGDGRIATGILHLTAAAPALFTLNQSGSGPAIALDAFSFTGEPFAATRANGEPNIIAFFGTGLGADATDVDGNVSASVEVMIGGKPAPVSYAGRAPGFTGLNQLNVILPVGITLGRHAVVVTRNAVSSNIVTVAIK